MSLKIDEMNLQELEGALKELKNYRKLVRVAGKRTESLRQPSTSYRVEYANGMSPEDILPLLSNHIPEGSDIHFVLHPKMTAGVRIFQGDDLLDCSFEALTKNIVI